MTEDRQPVLLVTRKLPAPVEDALAAAFDCRLNGDDAPYRPDELADFAAAADGIVCLESDRLDAETIAALDGTVRVILTLSADRAHVDLAAARDRGIAVLRRDPGTDDATGRALVAALRACFGAAG